MPPYEDGDGKQAAQALADDDEFLELMREQRIRDMLAPGSHTRLIHKFSLAFPAHIVATVMCIWFILAFTIVGLLAFRSSSEVASIRQRVVHLEALLLVLNSSSSSNKTTPPPSPPGP